MTRPDNVEFSVVIPTLNEESLLPGLLADLAEQSFRHFEVIVADAGSTDRTVELAKSSGARTVTGGIPAVGRNSGARVATGAFLVFLDADVRVSQTFLAELHDELETRFLDLATCEVIPISDNSLDRLLHEVSMLAIRLGQFVDPHAPGFCIVISRRLFRRVGGFDESLRLAEDHDLVRRASQFRPLRVLNVAQVQVSVRRLEKEGRIKLASKYVGIELYRGLIGEIRTDVFNYEFDNFSPKQQQELDAEVQESRRLLERLKQEYARLTARGDAELDDIPASALDSMRSQFNALKAHLRPILATMRSK